MTNKHKAKRTIVSKNGTALAYEYRGVEIEVDISNENKYSFYNVRENGEKFKSRAKVLSAVKLRIDRAFEEGRM